MNHAPSMAIASTTLARAKRRLGMAEGYVLLKDPEAAARVAREVACDLAKIALELRGQ